jgi:signal transduction histidine kinase
MDKKKVLLFILITICVLGHILSPPTWIFAHEFLFKFTHFPIVLSAIFWGRWFAIKLSLFFCIIYLFHIFLQLSPHCHHSEFAIFLDLLLYFVIAWVTGHLSEKQKGYSNVLKEKNEDLKEKTSLLINFREESKQADRYKIMAELSGAVAHEVRTPLSALQGAVEIILSEKTKADKKEKFGKMIFSEIKRINNVVEQFLELGTKHNEEIEGVELKEVIDELGSLLLPTFEKKKLQLEYKIEPKIFASIQSKALKQVLINLLMNALDASNENSYVRLLLDYTENVICLRVQDQGSGISDKIKSQLFEPFITGKENGAGLGLYLSKNIIDGSGGSLILEKSDEQGSVFLIKLKRQNES